jgi:hypothetical protein
LFGFFTRYEAALRILREPDLKALAETSEPSNASGNGAE